MTQSMQIAPLAVIHFPIPCSQILADSKGKHVTTSP